LTSYVLSAVRIEDDEVKRIDGIPPARCAATDKLEFLTYLDQAAGREVSGFGWMRDAVGGGVIDGGEDFDDEITDYCVAPSAVLKALDKYEDQYRKHPAKYPDYYLQEAFEVATGHRYLGAVQTVIDGELYRLRTEVGSCQLVLLKEPANRRFHKPVAPGQYEWQSAATPPAPVRVTVTRRSFQEFFDRMVKDFRRVALAAKEAKARLLPEAIL
jgi:hypothetical protein